MTACAPSYPPGISMMHDQPRSAPPPTARDELIEEAKKTREQLEALLNEVLELIFQTKQLANELAAKCDLARPEKQAATS